MTLTLAYALESHQSSVPEILIAMNLGKQAISFAFGFSIVDWIMSVGYMKIFSGIFCGVQLINNLMVVVFLLRGKKIRIFLSQSWLGRMHSESAKELRG